MDLKRMRTFQSFILALTGFFILEKIWSGELTVYINQRFVPLVLLAGLGLIILAQVVFQERQKDIDSEPTSGRALESIGIRRSNLFWLLIPLVVGIVVPPMSLDASSLAARGVELTSPFLLQGASGSAALSIPSSQRTVMDWIRAFSAISESSGLNGEAVDVIGFVYHDPRLNTNQFLISRYSIVCCIADATAIGIWVNWQTSSNLSNNQWVRVQGRMTSGQIEGQNVPVILADQVDGIPEPQLPYLFP